MTAWTHRAAALLLCAAPLAARAWGDAGHEVVARVADHFLTATARTHVLALLSTDTSGLAATDLPAQATWADKYRDSDRNGGKLRYEQTRAWHFVDIELDAGDLGAACFGHPPLAAVTPASRGPKQACIIDKIDQFVTELRAPGTPPAERLLALQFLLHLIGDLHQPLHASDDHDRGGNTKNVVAEGAEPGNLHRYWDVEFVRRLGGRPDVIARDLVARIVPAQRESWALGAPRDWAIDTFAVSKANTYGPLPAPGADGVYRLPPSYTAGATATVASQLSKAGVRLSAILNATFD